MKTSNSNWMDEAVCIGKGDVFFSETSTTLNNKKSLIQAKAMCSSCPVVVDCLVFAINNEEDYGVWGSFSARERSALVKHLKIKNLTKEQASSFVNKNISEIKDTFRNTFIFTGGKNK